MSEVNTVTITIEEYNRIKKKADKQIYVEIKVNDGNHTVTSYYLPKEVKNGKLRELINNQITVMKDLGKKTTTAKEELECITKAIASIKKFNLYELWKFKRSMKEEV